MYLKHFMIKDKPSLTVIKIYSFDNNTAEWRETIPAPCPPVRLPPVNNSIWIGWPPSYSVNIIIQGTRGAYFRTFLLESPCRLLWAFWTNNVMIIFIVIIIILFYYYLQRKLICLFWTRVGFRCYNKQLLHICLYLEQSQADVYIDISIPK